MKSTPWRSLALQNLLQATTPSAIATSPRASTRVCTWDSAQMVGLEHQPSGATFCAPMDPCAHRVAPAQTWSGLDRTLPASTAMARLPATASATTWLLVAHKAMALIRYGSHTHTQTLSLSPLYTTHFNGINLHHCCRWNQHCSLQDDSTCHLCPNPQD